MGASCAYQKTGPGGPAVAYSGENTKLHRQGHVLQAERACTLITVASSRVSLYLDYTMLVQHCWAPFQEVKRHLRTHGLVYALIFRAKLKVIHEQRSHFFDTPRAAREWLDQIFQSKRSDQPQEFGSQKLNRRARRTRCKQDSMNIGIEGPPPRQAWEGQLEAIQLATTLWDPSRRSSTESSLAGDSDTETEGSVALSPTITLQTANKL
ncbi:hypothetical protein NDU88_006141 [Pleurodeles waltl]|uniref:Uncharacterized protein n=1 Tax=Pleurodeles waltl TaxID=8319 RepID=A0AAV7LRK8_PLEWA|nr:hypothetical protein NDU88_006141 [Pleurodeles waltl]